MQTLLIHEVLVKRKEAADQFFAGLEALGILSLVRSNTQLMKHILLPVKILFTPAIAFWPILLVSTNSLIVSKKKGQDYSSYKQHMN